MKFSILFSLAIMCSSLIFGQDVITKRDGSELKTKVIEVGINEIKYKNFENPDGPTYVISKADVFMIKYENGEKDIIKAANEAVQPSAISPPKASSQSYKISPNIVKKTKTAGIIGYAMAAPIVGLATAAALSDDFLVGGIIGGVAALGLGVSAPLIARRARLTREITHVEGNYPARLTGWILYGIAITDAVVALGLTIGEVEVPNATVIALGALGAASSILFGLDASQTAEQSKKYQTKLQVIPSFGINRNHLGQQFTSVGVQLIF
jgi:hypothetical protein